jgi:hypothetical protein
MLADKLPILPSLLAILRPNEVGFEKSSQYFVELRRF